MKSLILNSVAFLTKKGVVTFQDFMGKHTNLRPISDK